MKKLKLKIDKDSAPFTIFMGCLVGMAIITVGSMLGICLAVLHHLFQCSPAILLGTSFVAFTVVMFILSIRKKDLDYGRG